MSWNAVKAVCERSTSYGTARLVLVALAERANTHPKVATGQVAWASARDLALRANVAHIAELREPTERDWAKAVRSTRRALKQLRADGEIEIVGRHRSGAVIHRITPGGDDRSGGDMRSRGDDMSGAVTSRPQGVTRGPGTPDDVSGGGDDMSPEPEENPNGNGKEAVTANGSAPPGFFEEKRRRDVEQLQEKVDNGTANELEIHSLQGYREEERLGLL